MPKSGRPTRYETDEEAAVRRVREGYKFCRYCGNELSIGINPTWEYDMRTGEKLREISATCKELSIQKPFGSPPEQHTRLTFDMHGCPKQKI